MKYLTHYLNQILDWHNRLGSPLSTNLQPGLSADEIHKKISVLPFKMPEEFVELYMWRDGTHARNQEWISFIEMHRFLPLEEALDIYQQTHSIVEHFYKNSDWVMTFVDGSGDGYGISAIQDNSSTGPVVFHFEGEGVNHAFESLIQMMKTMAVAFEAGVFSIGKDGDLETDFSKFGAVVHKQNPDIDYWTQYNSNSRHG